MKNLIRAAFPAAALLLCTALTAVCMAAGYSHGDFDVSFDDCKDLLDGIRIKGFVSDSRDELTYSFSLAAGRTDTAQVTTGYKRGHINNGYFVAGDSRHRDLMLKLETRLPDDAVLSDRELKFDSNGAAILFDGEHIRLYTDALEYQFYLTNPNRSVRIPLGEPVRLTSDENGEDIRVTLEPLLAFHNEDTNVTTYTFSPDPDDYAYVMRDNVIFPDEYSTGNLAFLEPVGSYFNVYHIDRVTDSVCVTEYGGGNYSKNRRICGLSLDGRELLSFRGGDGIAAAALLDKDCVTLKVNDSEAYKLDLDDGDKVNVNIVITNGAACFRIGFGGDRAVRAPMYIALSPKGELLAQGSGEAIALPDIERLWFNLYDDSFDAYFDGERLYTLDNISYTAGYDMSYCDSELLGVLNEYGGGFPGYIVSMTVMDRNGVVASGLRPLSIRVSGGRGSSQTVSVSFDMKR